MLKIIISGIYLNSSQQEKHTFFPAVNTSMKSMKSWHLNQLFNSYIFSNLDMTSNIITEVLHVERNRDELKASVRFQQNKCLGAKVSPPTSYPPHGCVRLPAVFYGHSDSCTANQTHLIKGVHVLSVHNKTDRNHFVVSEEWKQPTWLAAG